MMMAALFCWFMTRKIASIIKQIRNARNGAYGNVCPQQDCMALLTLSDAFPMLSISLDFTPRAMYCFSKLS